MPDIHALLTFTSMNVVTFVNVFYIYDEEINSYKLIHFIYVVCGVHFLLSRGGLRKSIYTRDLTVFCLCLSDLKQVCWLLVDHLLLNRKLS